MADIAKWMDDLKQTRDELRLQLHLGAKEAEDEWESLMRDWDSFLSKSQFEKSEDEVGEAARELGLKMKAAYERMKKAV
ncbi:MULTISPECIES: hypothetical protein [Ruegeria]|uniref:hypothetical protein n=1 Tax=Ruegeria TaxID=97050 RepID=UPI00147B4633|nr:MULTISPECIES: hypothetical protein [Ruegeria]NOD48489.1 hypothetical protein [Ruegeria sp. HKCCD5849]NOD52509.1 hypothetical protein [Ruegeria sp. HKCCD5851]NOD68612.1 hypothetical protein [Ruegeria sp. HKCCD7303]NOE36294.1 hypothetical protein [Ruegeria sp. HKCCD7318]